MIENKKKVLVFLEVINSFRYEGEIVKETDEFLTILDYKTQHKILLKKSDIKVLEEK